MIRRVCRFCLQKRLYSVKVPQQPTWVDIDHEKLPPEPDINPEMIDHLERLSLVEFESEAGVKRISSAIKSANKLYMVNTDGVEPLDSILEDRALYLRSDEVTEGDCKDQILQNAAKTIEDYFIAPPGNIPLIQKDKKYGREKRNNT